MRAMFGLVGLLVTILIMAWVWSIYTQPVGKAAKQAHIEASQIAGRAEDGRPAADTATFAGVEKPGGQLTGLKITAVDPTGPMATHFGLAVGDVIVKVGVFDVGTTPVDDVEDARNYIGADAYRANMDLVVNRGGQRITLPADRNAPTSPAPAPSQTTLNNATTPAPGTPAIAAQSPQQPTPQSQPKGNPNHTARGAAEDLVNQLNGAQNRGE